MHTAADLFAHPELEASLLAALLAEPELAPAIEAELMPDALSTPELRTAYRALLRGERVPASLTAAAPSAQPREAARLLAEIHAAGAAYALLRQAPAMLEGIREGTRRAEDLERLLGEAQAVGRATRAAHHALTPSGALVADVPEGLEYRAYLL